MNKNNNLISELRSEPLLDLQFENIQNFIEYCFDHIIDNNILDITCLSFNDDIIRFSSEFIECQFDKEIEFYLEKGGRDPHYIKKLVKQHFNIDDIICNYKEYKGLYLLRNLMLHQYQTKLTYWNYFSK